MRGSAECIATGSASAACLVERALEEIGLRNHQHEVLTARRERGRVAQKLYRRVGAVCALHLYRREQAVAFGEVGRKLYRLAKLRAHLLRARLEVFDRELLCFGLARAAVEGFGEEVVRDVVARVVVRGEHKLRARVFGAVLA
jgi:hypothetical protein